jgi:heme-degrading monooxygenase HmoA
MAKKDFVLMTKWATHEPFSEWTKGEANAFPVLNDPDSLYYLDVEHTGWGANL